MKLHAVLLFYLLILQLAYAEAVNNKKTILLQFGEIENLETGKTTEAAWWKGRGMNGYPQKEFALEQCLKISGIEVGITSAEFSTPEEAHQAAEFHSKNQASVFHMGSWGGSARKPIGDELWHVLDPTGSALLLRVKKICLLISCRGGDEEKRKQVAEMLAQRMAEKIRQGARVVMPSDLQKK